VVEYALRVEPGDLRIVELEQFTEHAIVVGAERAELWRA